MTVPARHLRELFLSEKFMFGEKDFELAYQYLQNHHYSKALPFLYEAAQQGHPLAYVWIENIYIRNNFDA